MAPQLVEDKKRAILSREDKLDDINGPATTKFFNKLQNLRDDLTQMKMVHLHKYVDVAEALFAVRTACFGTSAESLDPNYDEKITNLEMLWKSCGLSVTTKAHVLFRHVRQQIMKYDMPLGKYSEQALEACHYDFRQHYRGYKRMPNTAGYAEKLLQAVCSYNSLHLNM